MEFIKEDSRIYSFDNNKKVIARKLVEKAVEEIEKKGGIVKATCSYAKKWLEKNR